MKTILFILFLCPFFSVPCYAAGLPGAELFGDVYQMEEALPEESREISGRLKLDGSYDVKGALERLWNRCAELLRERVKAESEQILSLLALALLCSMASALCAQPAIRETTDRIGCCAAALLLTDSVNTIFSQASETIFRLSDYSHAALPAVFTIAAASGAVISAPAKYGAACLAMDMMITLAQRVILPCIYAYLALAVSQSLFENSVLQMLMNLTKWAVTSLLTLLTLGFGAYLSLTGLISSGADALAVKSARTLISRSLPIVGGILSDSSAVFLAAVSLIRHSAGVFSLIAVCAFCVAPLVLLLVKALAFKLTSLVLDFQPGSRLAKLLGSMGTVFSMLLAVVGCCGAMLLISIASGIQAVTAG